MAVTNEDEFRAWLKTQPREVCVAIAYRSAMRVLPLATRTQSFGTAPILALAVFRSCLTSGVAVERPTPNVRAAAVAASGARAVVSATRSVDIATDASARARADARTSAYAADYANRAVEAAASSVTAIAANAAIRAVGYIEYAELEVPADQIGRAAIILSKAVQTAVAPGAEAPDNALNLGGPWAFWAKWYARAMAGDPLPWDLQEAVALIPDDIWQAGPEAVAEEIARIEAEYWAERLPQSEELIQVSGGRFDVQADPAPIDRTLDNILSQVAFALDLALRTNCGFNEMCVAYKYLLHTLENCRNDPNAIEQHFRLARDILKRKIAEKSYDRDDALIALIDGLDQHALQMRGSFRSVRDAYEIRVQQKLRETDDKTMLLVAGGMRAFQAEKTTGRLFDETGLDAETVEQDSGVEAKAGAIQRTGGRAARASILERASQTAKDIDASGGYKSARIGTTGYTLVEMLTKLFGG